MSLYSMTTKNEEEEDVDTYDGDICTADESMAAAEVIEEVEGGDLDIEDYSDFSYVCYSVPPSMVDFLK